MPTASFLVSGGFPDIADVRGGQAEVLARVGLLKAAVEERGGVRANEVPMCPLCGNPGDLKYRDLSDRSWGAPGLWNFRECRRCGHLWLDPQPPSEEIGRLYESYYTHGTERPSPLEGDGAWPRLRRGVLEAIGYRGIARDSTERFAGLAARLLPPVWEECEAIVRFVPGPAHGHLLDVGSGDGSFLQMMRDLGFAVQGVEPDPAAAAVAKAHGLPVIESSIEQASLPDDTFDVIVMSHVIEHVADPVAAFVAARRGLRPGGRLLVFTPNSESWGHALFGRSWYPLEPPRHLHVFRADNLIRCAERAGLQVRRMRTTGRLHLIFDASRGIRKTGRYAFDDPAIQASVLERIFRVVENLLVRVGPNLGEELVMDCTKAP